MSRFEGIKFDVARSMFHQSFLKKYEDMEQELNKLPQSREHSLAITKLEESFMWVGKALKKGQESSEEYNRETNKRLSNA